MNWYACLRKKYGSNRVEDVFADTEFAKYGAELGFGLYVVRGCLPSQMAADVQRDLRDLIASVSEAQGCRAVQVRGKGPAHYQTLQVLLGNCICQYFYAASSRHQYYSVMEAPVLGALSQWLQQEHDCRTTDLFHQIVANQYSQALDEAVDWHTDANPLLAQSTDVIGISLGGPGIFCYQPHIGKLSDKWRFRKSLKGEKLKQECRDRDLRGCVPLFAGDLLLSTGTFMEHCQHKTLRFSHRPDGTPGKLEHILEWYPSTSPGSKELLQDVSRWTARGVACLDRGVVTFRRTTHHQVSPRCPELPACAAWSQVSHPCTVAPIKSTGLQRVGAPRRSGSSSGPSAEEKESSLEGLVLKPAVRDDNVDESYERIDKANALIKEVHAQIKKIETTLSEIPETDRGSILDDLDFVKRSADRILRQNTICKIAVRAHELDAKMQASFEPGPEHVNLSHPVFLRGTNNSNAIRLLVSVNCALEIFRNFSFDAYVASCC